MQPLAVGAHSMDFSRNHFDLFGLPAAYALDAARLEAAYRGIQGEIHPDRFAHAGEAERRLSMQWATRVNEAYQTLKKPFARARYLLELNGVDALDPRNTAMPPAFLMQQMEWREALMAARAGAEAAALGALEATLETHARALERELARLLDQDHDYARAGAVLREVRFMDKLLEEIDAAYEGLE